MIDPSIAMGIRPAQFDNPLNGLAQIAQIQGAMQQNRLAGMQLQEAQRQNRLQQTVRGLIDVNTDTGADGTVSLNQGRFVADLSRLGYGDKALDYQQQFTTQKIANQKASLENLKMDAETKKALTEHAKTSLELAGKLAGAATDQETWSRALQIAKGSGLDISKMPEKYDPKVAQQIADWARTEADKLNTRKQNFEEGPKFQEDIRHHNMQYQVGMAQAENAANSGTKPQRLPADKGLSLSDQQTGIEQLDKTYKKLYTLRTTEPGGGKFAPLIAPVRSLNPWDTHAQEMDQYVTATKQIIGKALEGGVLRKEDEAKYEKVIPKKGDLPETLTAKYNQLRDMLMTKRNNEIKTYNDLGYVTGNVQPTQGPVSGVPSSQGSQGSGAPAGRVKAGKGGVLMYHPSYGG